MIEVARVRIAAFAKTQRNRHHPGAFYLRGRFP
jgi:hypothetical protein